MAGSPAKRRYAATKEYAEVKKALLEQLTFLGLDSPMFTDKVEEYMAFWVRRRQLKDDVEKRGLLVTDDRGRVSENRSVSLEIQVSRQMLAILQSIGLRVFPVSRDSGTFAGYEDDGDEL